MESLSGSSPRKQGLAPRSAYFSLLIFTVYAAIHLFGLHRAEQRKTSPVAA